MPLDSTLPVHRLLPAAHHILLAARDDRHTPAFQMGDLLIVDPLFKAPEHGGYFAINRQTGAVRTYSIEQCRRACLVDECYVLGASAPLHRQQETVDGFYDRDHFVRSVQGRVVGILRDGLARPV